MSAYRKYSNFLYKFIDKGKWLGYDVFIVISFTTKQMLLQWGYFL